MPNISDLLATNTANIATNTTAASSPSGPYKYITKVAASGSSTVSATNVFSSSDGFSAYRIILDSCLIAANSNQIEMRFAVGGSVNSSTVYGWSAIRHYGTSGPNGTYEATDSKWRLMPSVDVHAGYNIVIDLINTASGSRLIGMWNCAGGNSSRLAGLTFGSGSTSNTDQISGFEIYSNSSFTGGTVRIYGVYDA